MDKKWFQRVSTAMMGNNLVDEGIELLEFQGEYQSLKDEVSKGGLICPTCQHSLYKVDYIGYYDSHSMWVCPCVDQSDNKWPKEDKAKKWRGGYA